MSSSSREETRRRILEEGAIVAVRLGGDTNLLEVCAALAKGGLRVLELTLTTPGAVEAIAALCKDDALVVGGGTVLSVEDARRVAEAGGRFAFSPVVDLAVMSEAQRLGMTAVPGAATPTEILAAQRGGADLVKVFPSGLLGGADYLRKVRGPLPDVPLVPTSGPTAATLADYFAAGAAAVGVGGDELFPPGFSLDQVEGAARSIRAALDAVQRERR